ncbi:serine/threonine protein kinase [Ktedonosporobacter rubrisoli]|nr:serine/threonine-protein kinase [Ktedonosporobacter rubrisoli]
MKIDPKALIGQNIDGYHLERLLGEGGMGVVYRAHHVTSGGEVAIKFLKPKNQLNAAEYAGLLTRFRREARIIGNLRHRHIIHIIGTGEYRDIPYLVMPYIAGGTLADKIARDGPLPLHEVLYYVEQAADALMYAHAVKKIVHRDLKPANFLLDMDDNIILTDFGIARIQGSTLTKTGEFIGTPEYAAPEIWHGRGIDYRADIYSLGVILFEMLTGYRPTQADPRDSDLEPEIEAIIKKAMAMRPSQRYDDAWLLAEDLRDAAERLYTAPTQVIPAPQAPTTNYRPASLFIQRHRPVLGWLLLCAVALIVGISASIWLINMNAHARYVSGVYIDASTPTTNETASEQARDIVQRYYTNWEQKRYKAAYALLDEDYQKRYPYEMLQGDYQHTHKICMSIDAVTALADGTVRVDITDNAVEDIPGKAGTATNLYQGYYIVKRRGSGWRIIPHLQLKSLHGVCKG